ncbi:PKD domain-containing protein [Nanoarchaeota archaeon]
MRSLLKIKSVVTLTLILILLASSTFSMKTLVVEETDLVSLVTEVVDGDGDEVIIAYSDPIDDNGEWQTDYGDAGNYTIMVTATDKRSVTEEEFLLEVTKKNRAPEIIFEDVLEIFEGEELEIEPEIYDLDGDDIEMTISAPLGNDGVWTPDYDEAGEYPVLIGASDGQLKSTKLFTLIVKNKNREPLIESFEPEDLRIYITEEEEMQFFLKVEDPDEDKMSYFWQLDGENVSQGKTKYAYEADYASAGSHELQFRVTDGENDVTKTWTIDVENVNRAPVLEEIGDIEINEGELLTIELPDKDIDGDYLIYEIDEPIGEDKEWQTGYDDAGEYEIDILISDGELTDEGEVKIIVNDVDRAPDFEAINDLFIVESDRLRVELFAEDPDGDDIFFLAKDLPEGATIIDDELVWKPGHEFLARPDNFFYRWLNKLRLAKYLWLKTKTVTPTLLACGKDLCTNQTIEISISNENRLPELEEIDEIEITETDHLEINPVATDADGDHIVYYFSEPLNSKGEWQTGYDDAGEYTITVEANDGESYTQQSVEIVVNNLNRKPEMADISTRKVNEGETVWIQVVASDLDGDELDLWVEDMPAGASFEDGLFTWTPDYSVVEERKSGAWHNFIAQSEFLNRKLSQEKKVLVPVFVVSDGDYEINQFVNIVVRNLNQPPEIDETTTEILNATVGEPVLFTVDAFDVDGDELTYEWNFGFLRAGVDGVDSVQRTYMSPGQKKVVLEVSDGRDAVRKEWRVNVVEAVVEPIVEKQSFQTYVV